jgi:ribosomal protein S18 acetylase RimI-like enzyme
MPSNLERMIQLAEEFFETKNDPAQISVNEEVMKRLRKIHPSSLSEHDDGNGPVAWVLLIPTTSDLMNRFIAKQITEKELLEQTPVGGTYDAIYLCSALVLPEQRRKGLARQLTSDAIRAIARDHPVKQLFYWAFSKEGEALADAVALECGLALRNRPE